MKIASTRHGPSRRKLKYHLSCMRWRKRRRRCVFGGGFHETIDDNGDDKQAQSSLDEQQYACKASSACVSGGDSFP